VKTVPEFLAHSIALEEESASRFDELADALEVHHNGDVVELFRKMAHFSRLHLADVQERAKGMELPHYAPWEFKWPDADSPEAVGLDEPHYKMTAHHALTAALASEKRGHAFYASVAQDASVDAAVKPLAQEFADEEAEHIALLEGWLKKYPVPAEGWDEDMDPPVGAD
jgi:rubrerythrin